MKLNLHGAERVIRIVLGASAISLAFFSPGELWYLIGLLPFVTGAFGFCPVYKLLNFSTRKT